MSQSRPSTREHLTYFFCLWLLSFGLFLLLDFSKRLDDILLELTYSELAASAFAPLLLLGLLAGLSACGSLALDRLGARKLPHFLALFVFLTINWWSLRAGLADRMAPLIPPTRLQISLGVLVVILLASALLARRCPPVFSGLTERKIAIQRAFVLLLTTSGLCSLLPPPVWLLTSTSAPKPNVILVSLDGLSASHMSLYGYQRQTTPELTKFGSQSWVFERFHSNYSNTIPSLFSLEGSFPKIEGETALPTAPGLFQHLYDGGYRHQGFFSYMPMKFFFGSGKKAGTVALSGRHSLLYRAFSSLQSERQLRWLAALLTEESYYFWPYDSKYDSRGVFDTYDHYPADLSLADALSYLQERPQGGCFVWVHLWTPHSPYHPDPVDLGKLGPLTQVPPEFINRPYHPGQTPWVNALRDRYDERVLSADRKLGRFLEQLQDEGLTDNSWIIVTSDHGDSFSQGFVGHSGSVINQGISHVPLLIRPPGKAQPQKIKTFATQVDLAPTMLELLGLPARTVQSGESLVPYVRSPQQLSSTYKFGFSDPVTRGGAGDIAIYWTRYKVEYLNTKPEEARLYDIAVDPKGVKNIAAEQPELVEQILRGAAVR